MIHCPRTGGFDKRPLEIAVDLGASRLALGVVVACVHARGGAGVGGQAFAVRKAGHLADLKADPRRHNHSHTGQAHQSLLCQGDFNQLFSRTTNCPVCSKHPVDLLQHLL